MSFLNWLFGKGQRPLGKTPKSQDASSRSVSGGMIFTLGDTADGGTADQPGADDYAALDQLLAQIETELRSIRTMPIRRLRRKVMLGGQAIAWSYSDRQERDLDLKEAELLLNTRLAFIGLGLSGSATWTSDTDGSTLAFWRIGHPQFSETPAKFKEDIQRLENLNAERQSAEAKRLAKSRKFELLIAWLCEAKYYGIPANELRGCDDAQAAESMIRLLKSPYSDIRQRAASVLGPLGGDDAVQALCSLLPKAEGQEVLEIAYSLFRLPSSAAIQPLADALHRATDFYHRVYLAKALARSGGEEGLNTLIAGLNKGDNEESENAQALLALDDARATAALKAYLERLQMRGAAESYQKPVKDFLSHHGQLPECAAVSPAEIVTSLGFTAKEAVWSVQPGVAKLREAIKNTWNVDCRVLELTEEQAERIRRQSPIDTKQWAEDGQYQIELGPNSISIHAYGSWVDFGYLMFLYRKRIYYVNVAPGVNLTQFVYARTDELSHMAKIAITLANHFSAKRETILICLEGDLAQNSGS